MATSDQIKSKRYSSQISMITDGINPNNAIFQHSVLCQTSLPYRNPGDEMRLWQRMQGDINLAVQAGNVLNPETNKYEPVGLPYGPKARLILAYINSEAIRTQKREIDVEDSMTAFIRRIGLNTDGRTINQVKEQLRRLVSSVISLGYTDGKRGLQVDLKIIKAFDLWFPKDERQRVLWTSQICLTEDYFNSLAAHAIPLDERALAALSNNAMALDIYAWLAQRLHRIDPAKPQFIAWSNLKDQFGFNYSEMRKFKQVFRKTLKIAQSQYFRANIEEVSNKGLLLKNSPPPIPPKTQSLFPLK
jgi:hypothetical protein